MARGLAPRWGPAYPRYERLALRLIGINEFVLLTDAPAGSAMAS